MSTTANEWADHTWEVHNWNLPEEGKLTRYSDRTLIRRSNENAKTNRRERVLILGDWLHPEWGAKYLAEMLDTIRQCPNLDFMLVTERPDCFFERVRHVVEFLFTKAGKGIDLWMDTEARLTKWLVAEKPPSNIWIGAIIKDQASADDLIPHLLRIPSARRFVIYDPTGAVDFGLTCYDGPQWKYDGDVVDWVIMRGETGPDAKPMHPDWARAMRDQCVAAGVPFWFEWGEWVPTGDIPKLSWPSAQEFESLRLLSAIVIDRPYYVYRVGKQAAGQLLDGVEWRQTPGGEA